MAEAEISTEAAPQKSAKGGKKKLLLLALPVLLLAGGGAAAFTVPGLKDKLPFIGGGDHAKSEQSAELAKPVFVQVPELTVTMPNAGRPRQMRIKLALELAKQPKEGEATPDVLSPRVNDALVLYLRTLRDAEVDGALSVDRMRGDLQRRLDLLMGDGVLRDVLITSLIIG